MKKSEQDGGEQPLPAPPVGGVFSWLHGIPPISSSALAGSGATPLTANTFHLKAQNLNLQSTSL